MATGEKSASTPETRSSDSSSVFERRIKAGHDLLIEFVI
jgi:hypothetical protein